MEHHGNELPKKDLTIFESENSDGIVKLKKQINSMIWENSPGNLTLTEADNLACSILNMIEYGKVST